MSENKHTPEPWRSEGLTILDADGHIVFRMDVSFYLPEERKEAARRIVACVNACAGIPTSDLESGGFAKSLEMFALESATFRRQRDELLAELQRFMDSHEECTDFDGFTAQIVSMDDYHQAQEAIESLKGEQP